jgi:Tfp pilus assembly protein PilX
VSSLRKGIDNRGAALVTVIVVTAFVTIIATTMLYITSRNFITKQVDYNNTVSFYEAEEALDTLKALLVQDVNNAYMYAYADAMANYMDQDEKIKAYYVDSYVTKLQSYWVERGKGLDPAKGSTESEGSEAEEKSEAGEKSEAEEKSGSGDSYNLTLVKNYMQSYGISADIYNRITGVEGIGISDSKDKFVIKGITAEYTSADNYSTYLKVDIVLDVPDVIGDGSASSENNSINITDCVKYMNWQRY